jgi:hypothetical protein
MWQRWCMSPLLFAISKKPTDLCLTLVVGYIEICAHIPIRCGENYMMEQCVS